MTKINVGEKNEKTSTTEKFHLKCESINRFVLNGVREAILFFFVSGRLPGYKVFL